MEKTIVKAEQKRLKSLLLETITLLCKNGLNFHNEICIEGLIGITVDQEDILLVNIKELIVLAEETYLEHVARNVQYNDVARIPGEIKPTAICSTNSASVHLGAIQLNKDPLSISESMIGAESTASSTRAISSIKETKKIRPGMRHDVDRVDNVLSAVNINNNLTSNVCLPSDVCERECYSPRSKKRRCHRTPERPCALQPIIIHKTSDTSASTGTIHSGLDEYLSRNNERGNQPKNSRHSRNIKLENSEELFEINNETLFEREYLLVEGNNEYDEVYETRGSPINGDVYVGDGGSITREGGGSVLPWLTLEPPSKRGSRSRQDMDLRSFPEAHFMACDYCGEQFPEPFDLYAHKCFLNINDTSTQSKYVNGFEDNLDQRKYTRNIHSSSGERPFHCETCSKPFTTLFNLQRHALIHTGERPFECSVCLKRFTQMSTLRTHERIHLRETVFNCQQTSV